MPIISFGDTEVYAHIVYDRPSRICVLIANDVEHLPDAVAVARTLKADHVLVIAPPEAVQLLAESKEYKVYELHV